MQITVVEPSVSTADSRLMSAFRRAMRRTPIASDTDKVAGRPSGTRATITPSANTNESTNALPVLTRSPNSRAPIAIATADTRLAMIATWRWSGLFSSSTAAVS